MLFINSFVISAKTKAVKTPKGRKSEKEKDKEKDKEREKEEREREILKDGKRTLERER